MYLYYICIITYFSLFLIYTIKNKLSISFLVYFVIFQYSILRAKIFYGIVNTTYITNEVLKNGSFHSKDVARAAMT